MNVRRLIKVLISVWTEEIEEMNMEMNTVKNKSMTIIQKEPKKTKAIIFKGQQTEQETSYEYLGVIISEDGKIGLKIVKRLKKANKNNALYNVIFGKKRSKHK